MITINKIIKYCFDSEYRFAVNSNLQLINNMADEKYIKKLYRSRMGVELNLDSPQSFNEKLQWLKLYDRNPLYTQLVDKYEVKVLIANKIGSEYIIPTLGVWNKFDDIDFDKLPNQFVLKCTHDSGGLVICKDKESLNRQLAKEKIERSLKKNYYYYGREWPYKNVKSRIIAEQFMVDESGVELKDYKIFNFNGQPRLIQLDFNRFEGHTKNLYTPQWELVDMEMNFPSDRTKYMEKPLMLDKMLELAKKLSRDIPFVRTDFYIINDKIYFGEMTFYPASGFSHFTPQEWDRKLGEWLTLPEKK